MKTEKKKLKEKIKSPGQQEAYYWVNTKYHNHQVVRRKELGGTGVKPVCDGCPVGCGCIGESFRRPPGIGMYPCGRACINTGLPGYIGTFG